MEGLGPPDLERVCRAAREGGRSEQGGGGNRGWRAVVVTGGPSPNSGRAAWMCAAHFDLPAELPKDMPAKLPQCTVHICLPAGTPSWPATPPPSLWTWSQPRPTRQVCSWAGPGAQGAGLSGLGHLGQFTKDMLARCSILLGMLSDPLGSYTSPLHPPAQTAWWARTSSAPLT